MYVRMMPYAYIMPVYTIRLFVYMHNCHIPLDLAYGDISVRVYSITYTPDMAILLCGLKDFV